MGRGYLMAITGFCGCYGISVDVTGSMSCSFKKISLRGPYRTDLHVGEGVNVALMKYKVSKESPPVLLSHLILFFRKPLR